MELGLFAIAKTGLRITRKELDEGDRGLGYGGFSLCYSEGIGVFQIPRGSRPEGRTGYDQKSCVCARI